MLKMDAYKFMWSNGTYPSVSKNLANVIAEMLPIIFLTVFGVWRDPSQLES